MRLGGAALALAILLAPTLARAGDIDDFEICRAAYEARDFPRAVSCFEGLVGGAAPRLGSPALINESRKYLGAAYLFVGRREAARGQFERLLEDAPGYVLDPLLFPVDVQELFTAVRERLELQRREAEARAEIEARARLDHERARRLLRFAEAEVTIEIPNSRWIGLFPFGVGQFTNGDDGLGWFFLLSETALAGAAIGTLAWHESLIPQVALAQARGNDALVAEGNRLLEAAFISHWVMLGALAVVAVAGVIEAQGAFDPERGIVQRRRVPDELRLGLEDEPTEDEEPVPAAPTSGLQLDRTGGLRF